MAVPPSEPLAYEVELGRTVEDGEARLELEVELEWCDDEATESKAGAEGEAGTAPDAEDASGDGEALLDVAEIEAPEEPPAILRSQATFEVFRNRADEWRCRLVHRNGNVVATSGEVYTTRHNAERDSGASCGTLRVPTPSTT